VIRRHRAAVALVTWTFLVWTTRIANVWNDADLDTGERWARTLLALSFTVLAVAVAATLWRRARHDVASAVRVAVAALAGWTTVVWLVRGTGILAGDHEAGFKAVHTVLAVVSIGLAAWAWRDTRRPAPGGSERATTESVAAARRR
jgi:Na+/melibiose symporter-like transporter